MFDTPKIKSSAVSMGLRLSF